ncbi:hypothetical protein ONE63_002059 [Megalurothrips usitatus]|uniref:Uncharacterized protein n=1 Tax=Megalurothrips usitatus TaxID=439358 RepID=A0AAV7XEI0_9NEOP|nr:hypothetical protein ONE63_002059 [Megalurothrips usitatus]
MGRRVVQTLSAAAPGARLLPLRRGLGALLSGAASVLCADAGDLQLEVRRLGRPALWCQLQTTPFTLPLAPEPLIQGPAPWRLVRALRGLEAGLWTRGRRGRVLADVRGLCAEASRGGVIPVALADVWLAPALLGAGVLASLLLLAAESARSWGSEQLSRWRDAHPRGPRGPRGPRPAPLPFTL